MAVCFKRRVLTVWGRVSVFDEGAFRRHLGSSFDGEGAFHRGARVHSPMFPPAAMLVGIWQCRAMFKWVAAELPSPTRPSPSSSTSLLPLSWCEYVLSLDACRWLGYNNRTELPGGPTPTVTSSAPAPSAGPASFVAGYFGWAADVIGAAALGPR